MRLYLRLAARYRPKDGHFGDPPYHRRLRLHRCQGLDEAARVCLTHSFPVKDIEADIAKKDITAEQYDFIKSFLDSIEYDDLDRLIILCDALADAKGFCILEKRFVDTTRRYGICPFTVDRWNKTFEYKEYFEAKAGCSVYSLLPGIEKCIY